MSDAVEKRLVKVLVSTFEGDVLWTREDEFLAKDDDDAVKQAMDVYPVAHDYEVVA